MTVDMLYTEYIALNDDMYEIYEIFDDPFTFFRECDEIEMEYYETMYEAGLTTTLKNFGEKAVELIKKFFHWMKKQFQRILSWIFGLFKKKSKTIDDIMIEKGIKVTKNNGKTKIEVDERCEMTGLEDLEAMSKPFLMQLDADGQKIHITFKDVNDSYHAALAGFVQKNLTGNDAGVNNKSDGPVRGFGPVFEQRKVRYDLVFRLIIEPSYQQVISNTAELILQNNSDESVQTLNRLKSEITRLEGFKSERFKTKNMTMTLDQLTNFQAWLNDIFAKVDEIGMPDNSKYENDKNVISLTNYFLDFLNILQYSMNMVSNAIKQVYIIDADYVESIDDVNVLGEFVDIMLRNGVPAKFVMFNATIAASKKIKGNADYNKPVCGQSRVVYFPDDKKIVYKVAASQIGVLANKAEYDLYRKMQEVGISKMFAATYGGSKSFSVVQGERVDTSKGCTIANVNAMKKKVTDVCSKHRIPIAIDHDIHAGNIGWRGNQMVVLDYGTNVRKYLSTQSS